VQPIRASFDRFAGRVYPSFIPPRTAALILRASVVTLQTASWIFSFWMPVLLAVAFTIALFSNREPGLLLSLVAIAAGSLAIAWALARIARALLDGSRAVGASFAAALVLGGVALLIALRGEADRFQAAKFIVWASVAIAWSLALAAASMRRASVG
jgi:Na+/melibiose symporter-like transporter